MSRIPKWKLEKTKVKVVFRLQFHATCVPQPGWDKLFLSFIPEDLGRVTAKTNKANVRNGACKWADPIYETTRLNQDLITKKYEDKVYKLVIAMGTSRSSCLGEAYINLSEYSDALKPVSVALPLQGCKFGTILHVSIQLLTSKTGFREFEVQREIREKVFHEISNPSQEPARGGDSPNMIMNKANKQVRFSQESGELYCSEETDEPDPSSENSAQELNSPSTSDGLYTERVEISSTNSSGPAAGTVEGSQKYQINYNHSGSTNHVQTHGWSSYFSKGNPSTLLDDDLSESALLDTKVEFNSSKSFADELTHQSTGDMVSGKAYFEELPLLRSGSSRLKDEFELLRNYKPVLHASGRRMEISHIPNSFHEYQSQILEGYALLERKIEILQSKVRKKENDVEILSDFESLDFILQNLRQHILASLSLDPALGSGLKQINSLQSLLDEELENKKIMNERICELLTQLEDSKAKQETLTQSIDKKILDYDTLILELEERNCTTLSELERVKAEQSSSLSTISVLQKDIEKIQSNTNEKIFIFSEEKRRLESINKELEERVIASEKMLERVRRTQSTIVDQLHKDLESLSSQVLSMFETNENLSKQRIEEAPKLLSCENQKPSNFAHKSNYLEPHQNMCSISTASDWFVECFKDGGLPEIEGEFQELHALNLHLEILVKILQETLQERNHFDRGMRGKMDELLKSERSLMLKLNEAIHGMRVLKEDVASYKGQVEGLRGEKNTLESKLKESHEQNASLVENLAKHERIIKDLNVFKQRCTEENSNLQKMVTEEGLQKSRLENECVLLKKELDRKSITLYDVKENFDTLKEGLKHVLSNTENYINQMKASRFDSSSVLISLPEEIEGSATIPCLERFQHEIFKQIFILKEEITERDKETCLLKAILKEKGSELEEITSKLDVSSSLLEKLQVDLQTKAESEQNLAELNKGLTSKLTIMEYKLKDAYNEMKDFSKIRQELEAAQKKITKSRGEEEKWALSLDSMKESTIELEKKIQDLRNELKMEREMKEKLEEAVTNMNSKFNDLETDKSALDICLHDLEEKLSNQDNEMSSLKKIIAENLRDLNIANEALKSKSEELRDEKLFTRALEDQMANLTSQISSFNGPTSELAHLRRQIVDLEFKKSSAEKMEVQTSNLQSQVTYLDTELCKAREKLRCIRDELQSEKETKGKLEATVSDLSSLLKEKQEQVLYFNNEMNALGNLRQQMLTLESEKSSVDKQLMSSNEKISELDCQISDLKSQLMSERELRLTMDSTISDLTSLLKEKEAQVLYFNNQTDALEKIGQQVLTLESEKFSLDKLLISSNERISELGSELSILQSQLMSERELRLTMDFTISNLTSLLKEKETQILYFNNEMNALKNLRQQMLTLESEKSRVDKLLICNNDRLNELGTEISNLQSQLILERDLRLRMDSTISDLQDKLASELQKNEQVLDIKSDKESRERELSNVMTLLTEKDQLIAGFKKEAELTDLRKRLPIMESKQNNAAELRSALSGVTSLLNEKQEQIIYLKQVISETKIELALSAIIEATFLKTQYHNNMQNLSGEFNRDKETNKKLQKDVQVSCQEEMEALKLFLEFEEELDIIRSSKEEHEIVRTVLQSKLIELCEYIIVLQEENKDLLHRLSELNVKAEEYKTLSTDLANQIKEKKESGESLRVALMREESETRVQDLKIQLDISKNHEEDLFLKLQSAVDEVELRKKTEALLAKVNEELQSRILETEADRCELIKASNNIMAELECCKEERSNLESSLKESTLEIEELRDKLELANSHLEKLTSESLRNRVFGESGQRRDCVSDNSEEKSTALLRNDMNVSVSGRSSEEQPLKGQNLGDQTREQENLKAGIKRLKQELQRMKLENLESSPCEIGHELLDPSLQGLEKKLLQLEMVTKHLGTLFPSLQESMYSGGSPLERVLVFELELAESLKKKKPDSVIQSSFPRQPGDEATMLRSFRDINELIGDVLNARARHAAVESELNNMHSRYSQLSLQLAEVEGERQRLLIKLKNCRSPPKS